MIHAHYHMWVPPFGNLRVNGYVLLTAAYRSLSRPSSAPSAKASSRCSLYLTIHCLMRVTSGLHSLLFTRCEFVSGFSQQIVIWWIVHTLFSNSFQSRLVSRFVVYLSLHLVCYSIFKVRLDQLSADQVVENKGLEPLTPCVQGRCSPSWANSP